MGNKPRGKAPKPIKGTIADVAPVRDHNLDTPKFCLRHLQRDYDVNSLPREQQAAFAVALQRRAAMTWREIVMAPRHGLGTERIPRRSIKARIPLAFEDSDEFLVLRYDGKLPMAGVRAGDVLHVLWIEKNFGDLYDHG
ncbi:hypothetical protein [Allokutzneria albata]|uniref:Uncharacterized protein n=1 Tax=Allokutzneria albata TaxID=211114 RepID=A0A1G9X117_ALLAB|nr:hypothetical protein [Allokutzneria albata]SDM90211.1 hypothetical protein SAMN04489726_3918 [Allokutzneria albata]